MSDTQVVEPGTTEEQAQAVAEMKPADAKVEKPKAEPKQPHLCLCASFEVVDKDDPESTFTTGCEQTTMRQFAQGHDARLVSFLVESHLDGYKIRRVVDGGAYVNFVTPAEAAAVASDKLRDKAQAATENGQAKVEAKKAKADDRATAKAAKAEEAAAKKAAKEAEKAAKAAAPKDVPVKVVQGSQTGDSPTPGDHRIKIGRFEFNATVDAEGTATYTDKGGNVQTIERDGYRLLG